jgi:DNA mismatch repair protein MutS
MMRQYGELKRRFPDYLLLFRLGDFYQLFNDDAHVASRLLQIKLTSRQKGEGAIPMAGIPHHAADGYIARLIRAGQKVAVCEQLEGATKGRKIVRRDVVRVITPARSPTPSSSTAPATTSSSRPATSSARWASR